MIGPSLYLVIVVGTSMGNGGESVIGVRGRDSICIGIVVSKNF